MGVAILALLGVALGAAISTAVHWVVARHQRHSEAEQRLTDARQRLYQEFLARTHHVVTVTQRIRTNPTKRPSREEANEALSAHRESGTGVQLLSSHPRLPELAERVVVAAGSDLDAALTGTGNSHFVTQDDLKRLMTAMREELGLTDRRENDVSWSPLS